MCFYDLIRKIQDLNKGKICIFRVGFFYTVFGLQSFVIAKEFNLSRVCFIQDKVCKVGMPYNVLDKYIEMLKHANISFCIYDYVSSNDVDSDFEYNNKRYKKTIEYTGSKVIDTSLYKIDCNNCKCKKNSIYSRLDLLEKMLINLKEDIAKYGDTNEQTK